MTSRIHSKCLSKKQCEYLESIYLKHGYNPREKDLTNVVDHLQKYKECTLTYLDEEFLDIAIGNSNFMYINYSNNRYECIDLEGEEI